MRSLAVVLCLAGSGSAFADKPAPVPTSPIVAKVLTVKVDHGATMATVSLGSDAGVDKDYACAFMGAGGTPSTGSCILVRIDKRTSVIKTSLTVDELKQFPTVKIGAILR